MAARKVVEWIKALGIQVLNVAGPSEKTCPGVGGQTFSILTSVFAELKAASANRSVLPERSKAGDLKTQPLPWWLGLRLSTLQRLGASILPALLVTTLTVLILVYVGTKFFGLRIEAGRVYLASPSPDLGAHATVDATAGFQNSGIHLIKGQKVILSPEGRVHTAMDHAANLARAVKGIIVQKTVGKIFAPDIRARYPMPELDESAGFYRDWTGPGGEYVSSDILSDCKLRKDLGWGALLAVVLPMQASAREDPYEVLKGSGLSATDLIPVPSETKIETNRDGWLTFIINEAVLSPLSPSDDSRIYYDTLKKTAETLTGDPRHRIPLESIPLIWFADNNGAFRVYVRFDAS